MHCTFRQLEVFRCVADCLSYTGAAARLNLTQPAVFAQVKQLEDQIGLPLIERIGRRLKVTEAGERVLGSAGAVLAELERLEADLRALGRLDVGRLDLAVVSTAKYTLPWLIGPFSRAHPGIDIRLTVTNREGLIARIRAQQDDLYVLGAVPAELGADHVRLAPNRIVLVAAPDHPLVGRRAIPLKDLIGWPLIMREAGSGTRRAAEEAFERHGVAPLIRHELGANEAVKQAAMAGLGIAAISHGAAQLELEHRYLAELDVEGFPLERYWSLAWNPGRTLSAAARALREGFRADPALDIGLRDRRHDGRGNCPQESP
jgi:DNA-binding transcriptional LysR family regulator